MSLTLPTNSGWSGFWQLNGDRILYQFISQAQNGGRSKFDNQIARIFKRNQYRDVVAMFNALIGATTGSNVTATYKRLGTPDVVNQSVPGVTGVGAMGGNRPIETVTVLNRNTTASDVTFLKKFFNDKLLEAGLTFVAPTGSGGGGKIVGNVVGF